jgi:hypothetical protein
MPVRDSESELKDQVPVNVEHARIAGSVGSFSFPSNERSHFLSSFYRHVKFPFYLLRNLLWGTTGNLEMTESNVYF